MRPRDGPWLALPTRTPRVVTRCRIGRHLPPLTDEIGVTTVFVFVLFLVLLVPQFLLFVSSRSLSLMFPLPFRFDVVGPLSTPLARHIFTYRRRSARAGCVRECGAVTGKAAA